MNQFSDVLLEGKTTSEGDTYARKEITIEGLDEASLLRMTVSSGYEYSIDVEMRA